MNKQKLIDKINKIQTRTDEDFAEVMRLLDSIGDKIKDYKNWVREVPEVGEEYFYPVISGGFYKIADCVWRGEFFQEKQMYFTNREDCELAVEILNRQRELIGDWKPDWGAYGGKTYLAWNHPIDSPFKAASGRVQYQGTVCMPQNAADQLIEEYNDKLAVILK